MANHLNQMFKKVIENFESLTENPEIFLKPSSEQNGDFKNVTKTMYDAIVQANSLTSLKTKALPKLLIEGFDEEQVWQQIELQNKNAISYLDALSNIDQSCLQFNVNSGKKLKNGVNKNLNGLTATESEMDDEEKESDVDEESDDEKMDDELKESDIDEESDDELDDDDSDEYIDLDNPPKGIKSNEMSSSEDNSPPPKLSSKKKYKTEVDDQFFKLSKLEQFLRLEDLKEERSFDETAKDDELSSEEEIDLFEDLPSDDEDSEDEDLEDANVQKKSSKDLMYKDFFDAPESGDESVTKSNESTDDEDENLDADEDMDLSETDSLDENAKHKSQGVPEKNSKNKTPFQLQHERTQEQIARFEKGLLEPAPWHLTGEVDALNRPTDALLNLQTDFDVNARPVIVEDKPLCEKLETMLKMTIQNKSYSDGVRQYKTSKEMVSEKKETVLEQNKSDKSLAQEYEDMYLKQKNKPEDEENPKHVAIKKLRDSLFPELQALFSHIPKPAVPDIKIVSNLPAISVEEVAPTSVSDVTLLAPEEVKKRSGVIKGQTERDDTDKKRERRKKKIHQKLKQKKREQESEENPSSGKLKKKEKLEALKKLKQHKNTKIAGMDGEKIKSSKDFFTKLQETMDSNTKQTNVKKKNRQ